MQVREHRVSSGSIRVAGLLVDPLLDGEQRMTGRPMQRFGAREVRAADAETGRRAARCRWRAEWGLGRGELYRATLRPRRSGGPWKHCEVQGTQATA